MGLIHTYIIDATGIYPSHMHEFASGSGRITYPDNVSVRYNTLNGLSGIS